jgi:site-specific DNA-methyltransferase (adenine-specific)
MQFDVIIGNPPYQLDDGGFGKSASPIYHKFVLQAKKLNPRYLSMIIPSRWFSGGKGLDDFRKEMLGDSRNRKIVDFENSSEVFAGVDIAGGVCYFLWNRDEPGACEVTNFDNGVEVTSVRQLDEFATFVRNSKAVPIVRKILHAEKSHIRLSSVISARKPFGIRGHYEPRSNGVPCWFSQKIGLRYADKSDITDNFKLLNKWKLLIPRAPIAGQTDFSKPVGFYYDGNVRIAKPGECCTESYLVACAFETKAEVVSFKSYLFTKIIRFLLLQAVFSQDVTREKFCFVPDLGTYRHMFNDSMLRERWNITDDEWAFIDSKISDIPQRVENSEWDNDD